jgi:outer membrane biosynthesis protein TonB
MDAVSEILLDRSRDTDKVALAVILSLVAHVLLLAAATFLPHRWDTPKADEHVMTISLGGPEGPVQGRNPIAAKAIQQAVPETVKPKNDAPPALTKPELTEAVKTARTEPKAIPKPDVKKPEPQLHGRTPTQGAQVNQSIARIETHGAAFGTGLATGGGGGGAARTDVADFCCPEYITTMVRLIKSNWDQRQSQTGMNTMQFVIHRDGTITDVVVEKGASPFLDIASKRALIQTQRLPPLPAAFTRDHLTVHLDFEYTK